MGKLEMASQCLSYKVTIKDGIGGEKGSRLVGAGDVSRKPRRTHKRGKVLSLDSDIQQEQYYVCTGI
jgi:hypothetical protein